MKIEIKKTFSEKEAIYVVDFLASQADVSKMKIKKAIELGGLWITKHNRAKKVRVKKIKTLLESGDKVELHFNPKVVPMPVESTSEIYKGKGFGVWLKPAGMMSDGTVFSDQGCVSYSVKKKYSDCHLIQRLDREVVGLMIVAYNKKMARYFSKQLNFGKIQKYYQIVVAGAISSKESEPSEIRDSLDGREAFTKYDVFKVDSKENMTYVNVELVTGRFHQIRRHFDGIGHPVMGDPKYGKGNKNKDGLKLVACQCIFIDPNTKKEVDICLPEELALF